MENKKEIKLDEQEWSELERIQIDINTLNDKITRLSMHRDSIIRLICKYNEVQLAENVNVDLNTENKTLIVG